MMAAQKSRRISTLNYTMAQLPNFTLPDWLDAADLDGMLRGIEKESLRMQTNGYLAQTPHPQSLGSTLTHPHITTDYSESLLELITSPQQRISDMLTMLSELHELVYSHLEHDELLWPLSMPCMLSTDDADIPLGDYGTSNIGQLKTLYRHGLGLRYGRRMQTISGLHYNLSFPDRFFEKLQQLRYPNLSLVDVKNTAYLGLIRNFKRLSSMVLYLLGASPCVCPCFLHGRQHHLQTLDSHTLYLPHATSLRMGKLGYQNSAQDDLNIRYNTLPDYIRGLRAAISEPHADFTALGVDAADGHPIQINDHILQIENEFYSTIRPKQVAASGESPTHALENRGIAYIELRAIDVDPYSPVGISTQAAHFLETLALYCLLMDSPELQAEEESILAENQRRVVNQGRDTDTLIHVQGQEVSFADWMTQHLRDMQPVARVLDELMADDDTDTDTENTLPHTSALNDMLARAADVSLTPSAKVMADTQRAGNIWKMGSKLAHEYAAHYASHPMSDEKLAAYRQMAETSLAAQADLEAKPDIPFREFVQQYR